MAQEHHSHELKWIGRFLGHILTSTTIFVIIALPAVGLSFLIAYLEGVGVSGPTLVILTFLKYAILVLDVFLCAAYLSISAFKAVREMLK